MGPFFKRYRSLLVLCACLLGTAIPAQPQEPPPLDLVYRIAPNYQGRQDSLHLRLWIPEVNGSATRPLVVWVHGGAFYAGSYRGMDTICKRWSERGYVAVSVQYRLGYYSPFPVDPPYAYDQAEIIRACWRATQDVRAAWRFLADSSEAYRIDTSCIVVGGESAGSIITLQALIADPSDSIPKEVAALEDVVRGFDRFPRPDLGSIDPRQASPLPTVSLVLNRFGALLHPYMLQADDVPALFSYHQRGDLVVSCGIARGLWGLPLDVGGKHPVFYGSCAMEQLLEDAGHDASLRSSWFVEGLGHERHAPALVQAREFAAADQVRCTPVMSVMPLYEDNVYSDASGWTAYDVLGRTIATGTGGLNEAARRFDSVQNAIVFVVCGERVVRFPYFTNLAFPIGSPARERTSTR